MIGIKAANDNEGDRFSELGARAEELYATFLAPDTTEEARSLLQEEIRAIVAERDVLLAGILAEPAALKRQIIELGGKTIRRVVQDTNGNNVIF